MAIDPATGFINKTLTAGGRTRRYVVYVPHEYTEDRAWPLIVYLHGRGERGDDGLKQTDLGLPRAIRRAPERFPALVVMPQCPKTSYWDGVMEDVDGAYAQTVSEYNTASDRHYLTGLSMGGYGAWSEAVRHPGRYAALLVICGGGKPEDAAALRQLPTWVFHGALDDTVPPSESRVMVDALKAVKGNVRYTEYKDLGHFAWDETYGDPKVVKWLFKQRRR